MTTQNAALAVEVEEAALVEECVDEVLARLEKGGGQTPLCDDLVRELVEEVKTAVVEKGREVGLPAASVRAMAEEAALRVVVALAATEIERRGYR